MKLKDNLKFGLALGFAVPVAVFFGIYFFRFSYYPFSEFLTVLKQESRLITFFSAWCLVANIALFTLFINAKKDRSSKGIFIMSVVWGAAFLLLRWLM